jgi:hypothetical protein
VWAQQQRPLKATDLKLPEKPIGQFISCGQTFDWYRVEDLPPECADGWILCRLSAGAPW